MRQAQSTTDTTNNPNGTAEAPHPNGATAKRTSGPIYSRRFKLVASLILLVAIAALAGAVLTMGDGDDSINSSGGSAEYVEQLLPPDGSQVPQQSTVGIDLEPGWEGTLIIDGQAIPEDQINYREDLYLVEFTPGQGKVFEALPEGSVCITAQVWEISVGREAGQQNVSWCFEVV